MREFPRIMTNVKCGWDDEVGSSLTSYAISLGNAQQQACEPMKAVFAEAEHAAAQNVTYHSQSSAIQSCKID